MDTGTISVRFTDGNTDVTATGTFVDTEHVSCIVPNVPEAGPELVTTVHVALNGEQFTTSTVEYSYYGMIQYPTGRSDVCSFSCCGWIYTACEWACYRGYCDDHHRIAVCFGAEYCCQIQQCEYLAARERHIHRCVPSEVSHSSMGQWPLCRRDSRGCTERPAIHCK